MFVGLTGGTGCGKTFALRCFSSLRWKTLDADTICHALYEDRKSGVATAIVKRWGKGIILEDGRTDRRKIAEIVFNDGKELAWLNSLLHPKVLKRARMIAEKSRRKTIIAVPLLFEAGWEKEFDFTVAVWSEKALQTKRLKERGWSKSDIEKRSRAQLSPEEKMERADFALINNGTYVHLFKQCERLTKYVEENYGKKRQTQLES